MTLNPDAATAATLTNVDLVAQWAGIDGQRGDPNTVRGSLFRLLGLHGAEHPRIVGIMDPAAFQQAVATWQIPQTSAAATPPSFAQLGQAGIFSRTCRHLVGLDAPTVQPTPPVPPPSTRKIKLSQVINQADDHEIEAMDSTAISRAYATYQNKVGGFPPDDEELSQEQLATLNHLLQSGRTPYVDMAIWGPFQHRIQKKIKMKGMRFTASGEITTVELYGPPDFEAWRECYSVFRTGCIMFDAIAPARLDQYEKVIRKYAERYGKSCWPIIYQADVRARLEQTERLRRQGQDASDTAAASGHTHPFNAAKPWDWVWKELSMDMQFWHREIEEPCILYLTKTANMQQMIDDDAPVEQPSASAGHKAPPRTVSNEDIRRAPKRAKGPDIREHKVGDDGLLTHNRRGIELCRNFQTGNCEGSDPRGFCKQNSKRRHQCAKCLSDLHGAHRCTLETPRTPRPNHPKGRGKGRGRKWQKQSMHENSIDELVTMTDTATAGDWKLTNKSANGNELSPGAAAGPTLTQYKRKAATLRILHLFSGPSGRPDGFAKYLKEFGIECDEIDTQICPAHDLLDDEVWLRIYNKLMAGFYDGVLVGPPCNTYTCARKMDSGPGPLRSAVGTGRYGLDGLKPIEQSKVKAGTLLAQRASVALETMREQGKPAINEQPLWKRDGKAVSMYNLDEFVELLNRPEVRVQNIVQCEYGARTSKPTTLMLVNIGEVDWKQECTHPPVLWIKPSTGEKHWGPHPPLKGKEWYIPETDWHTGMLRTPNQIRAIEASQPFLTAAAQAYPGELNRKFAEVFHQMLQQGGSNKHRLTSFSLVGRWKNTLINQNLQHPQSAEASVRSQINYSYALRGKERIPRSGEEDSEFFWGGMRQPGRIVTQLPGYRQMGVQIYKTLMKHLDTHPEFERSCLHALGSLNEADCPSKHDVERLRAELVHLLQIDKITPSLDTELQASLIWHMARGAGDPDADEIFRWLTEGAPAGIELNIEDPGHIFPPDNGEQEHMEWCELSESPFAHSNYSSVDEDIMAGPEVERLIDTGFVFACTSLSEFEQALQGKPHLSKLGMITKEKDGRTKRRLILDCKESKVNIKAKKGGRLILPRLTDVVDDALHLMHRTGSRLGEDVEWLILDFTDWFFNIPLHPQERKHFTMSYKGTFIAYKTQAQGSMNAPLVCGRVAALIARLTQAIFGLDQYRLQIYVDDPCICVCGNAAHRDRLLAATVALWNAMGIRLAYKKAQRGKAIVWIGASLEMFGLGTKEARVRATAKQEIVDEIRAATLQHLRDNVTSRKTLMTYIGKLNHLAGIVEQLRPFMSDLYGVLYNTDSSRAPNNCFWTRQWRHVSFWIKALLEMNPDKFCREYRVANFFGNALQIRITTDASPWGLGGHLGIGDNVLAYFSSPVSKHDETILGITIGSPNGQQILEALALLVALRLWRRYWSTRGVHLQVKGDSVSTLTLVHKLRTKVASVGLSLIARELALEFGNCSYKPRWLTHIAGISNSLADMLSREHQPGSKFQLPGQLRHARQETVPIRDRNFYVTLTAASQRR